MILVSYQSLSRKSPESLQESNLLLRNQVNAYETTLKAIEVEVKAAQTCLRDRELELRRYEVDIKKLQNVNERYQDQIKKFEEHVKLLEEKVQCFEELDSNNQKSEVESNESLESAQFVDVRTIPRAEGYSSRKMISTLAISQGLRRLSLMNPTTFIPSSFFWDSNNKNSSPRPVSKDLNLYPLRTNSRRKLVKPKIQLVVKAHSGAITALSCIDNIPLEKQLLLSGGYDGFVTVLQFNPFRISYSIKVSEQAISSVYLSSDQKYALVSSSGAHLNVADLEHQKVVGMIAVHQSPNYEITGCGFINCELLQITNSRELLTDEHVLNASLDNSHWIATGPLSSKLEIFDYGNFLSQDRLCYSVGTDRSICAYSIQTRKASVVAKTSSPITDSFLLDDGHLILGHQNGCITVGLLRLLKYLPLHSNSSDKLRIFLVFQQAVTIQPLTVLHAKINSSAVHGSAVKTIFCIAEVINSDNEIIPGLRNPEQANKRVQAPNQEKKVITGFSFGHDRRLIEFSVNLAKVTKCFLVPSHCRFDTCSCRPLLSPSKECVLLPAQHAIYCWSRSSGTIVDTWQTPSATTCAVWTNGLLISAHTDGYVLLWKFGHKV